MNIFEKLCSNNFSPSPLEKIIRKSCFHFQFYPAWLIIFDSPVKSEINKTKSVSCFQTNYRVWQMEGQGHQTTVTFLFGEWTRFFRWGPPLYEPLCVRVCVLVCARLSVPNNVHYSPPLVHLPEGCWDTGTLGHWVRCGCPPDATVVWFFYLLVQVKNIKNCNWCCKTAWFYILVIFFLYGYDFNMWTLENKYHLQYFKTRFVMTSFPCYSASGE